ncbi:MAG: hypothetical protein ABI072_00560, partial [Edaphobacter sp.]
LSKFASFISVTNCPAMYFPPDALTLGHPFWFSAVSSIIDAPRLQWFQVWKSGIKGKRPDL